MSVPFASVAVEQGPDQPPERCRILVLNHHRDALGELVEGLRRSGFPVDVAESLAETEVRLDDAPPDVTILNPLVLEPGCVELELIERLQLRSRPVPVILLVDDPEAVRRVFSPRLPLCDFLLKSAAGNEAAQRVQLALHTRDRFLALHERARELEGQVSVDFKTDLLSERYFRRVLELEFKRARRHRTPLSLLLLDVDDFKSINDRADYAFGDEVLRQVATNLKRNIRETDFAARFGGDEFVLLLPHTTPAEAVQTAMRIRSRVARSEVANERYTRTVTLSIGIDTFDGRRDATPEDLKRRANMALQQAKRRGKNQVWLYSDEPATGADGRGPDQMEDAGRERDRDDPPSHSAEGG